MKEKLAVDMSKRDTDEMLCRGNSLTSKLYDVYDNYKAPKKVYNALESKYKYMKKGIGTDSWL